MKRPIIPYNPKLIMRARELRNNSTLSEVILWKALKGKKVQGFDFHRQRPVDNYVVDFICGELWLVIELDGYSHQLDTVAEKDERREARLQELGLRVIRFWDEEVLNDIDSVLEVIHAVVSEQREKFSL